MMNDEAQQPLSEQDFWDKPFGDNMFAAKTGNLEPFKKLKKEISRRLFTIS